MATPRSQNRWRSKHRLVKSQLNVMARKATHDTLAEIARDHDLRGKAEAVAFACFVLRALIQRGAYNPAAAEMLDDFVAGYRRDRDLYSP